jgi:integrase
MDVNLEEATIRINSEGANNQERVRVLPLNEEALWAVKLLLARAQECGSTEPEHYLIPFRVKRNSYDPTRPSKGWRSAFEAVLSAADTQFRQYDLRHTAITRLLENPEISEETVIAMAGHVSQRMLKRYSHVRIEAKRAAVQALRRKPPKFVKKLLSDSKTA